MQMQVQLCSTNYTFHVRPLVLLRKCVSQYLHFLLCFVVYTSTTDSFGINLNDICCVDNLFCSWRYAAFQRPTGLQTTTSGIVSHSPDGHPHRVCHSRRYSSVEPLLYVLDRGILHHCQVWLAHVVRWILCQERQAFWSLHNIICKGRLLTCLPSVLQHGILFRCVRCHYKNCLQWRSVWHHCYCTQTS